MQAADAEREPAVQRVLSTSSEPVSTSRGAAPMPEASTLIERARQSRQWEKLTISDGRVQRSPTSSGQRSPSGPVSGRTIRKMERSLGADFSSIEFRTDGSLGEPLGPLGKVHRSTVSLAPSLSPDSALGQAVIGHELAHVTQRTFDRGPSDHPARERDAIRRGTLAPVASRPVPALAARLPMKSSTFPHSPPSWRS